MDFSLRKVKLDQRKLTDNVNAVSDIARLQSSVYDIVSQMLSNQTALETKFHDLDTRVMTLQVFKCKFLIKFSHFLRFSLKLKIYLL